MRDRLFFFFFASPISVSPPSAIDDAISEFDLRDESLEQKTIYKVRVISTLTQSHITEKKPVIVC